MLRLQMEMVFSAQRRKSCCSSWMLVVSASQAQFSVYFVRLSWWQLNVRLYACWIVDCGLWIVDCGLCKHVVMVWTIKWAELIQRPTPNARSSSIIKSTSYSIVLCRHSHLSVVPAVKFLGHEKIKMISE